MADACAFSSPRAAIAPAATRSCSRPRRPLAAGDRIVDVGAGTGAVGLMISALRANPRLTFVEREAPLAALCRQNAVLNGCAASVVEADLLDSVHWPAAGLLAQSADTVATNPPFLEKGRAGSRRMPGAPRRMSSPKAGSSAWIAACASLLKPRGVWR